MNARLNLKHLTKPHPALDEISPCVICGAIHKRKDVDKWVYYKPVGVMCRHHNGVMEYYESLIEKENEWRIKYN